MEHKTHILLAGESKEYSLSNIENITLHKCSTAQEALENFIETDLQLMVCPFQMTDKTALELNKEIQSFLSLYPKSSKQDTKLLVITHNTDQEKQCQEHKIMHFPERLDLSVLLIKLVDSLKRTPEKDNLLPINFEDLFRRVDNNRIFIKEIIERFFNIYKQRTDELRELIKSNSYQETKDSAHKLKGVLNNFSMEKARITIIEIEHSALAQNSEQTLSLIDKLEKQIKEAQSFYLDHHNLFNQ